MNPTPSNAAEQPRTKKSRRLAAASSQMSLFADDVMGAIAVLEIADDAKASVDAAIDANPSILPPAHEQPSARDELDYARFMRMAGVPETEVKTSLEQVGANPEAVMAQLAQVEAEVGAAYPEEMIAELEDSEVTAEEPVAEDLEPEPYSDEGPVKAAAKSAMDETSATSLNALMKRIRGSRYEPLTVEQETALAARIRSAEADVQGVKGSINELLAIGPQLPATLEPLSRKLSKAEAAYAAARNELADHNIRFLVVMAKRFRYTGRPLDELISAGTTGLISAAIKFDPARGRFTTCAQHWIRQAIQRSLLTDSLMKTPAYMPAKESKLRKEAEAATDDELRAKLTEQADNLKREIAARRATHVSLDGGADDDSDSGGLHNIFASDSPDIEDNLEHSRLVSWLIQAANRELKTQDGKCDERARDIFLLRVGLHHEHYSDPQTLAEISSLFNVSRERIRQIFNEAALEIVNAVEHYAKGADNLPEGFRDGLLNLGRRTSAPAAAPIELSDDDSAAMQALFAAETAGPGEVQKRTQLVEWLVKAANRELKTDAGKPDILSRDVFLMRVGLHKSHYGEPQSVAQVGRRLGISPPEVRRLYEAAADEVAYAVEHYAKSPDDLPQGFRKSLMSPGR
jgi:RNA polymerase sigma factor (sigma-70 family)